MKKIKYLLLFFPLLFITNVKAEECHNYIDFTNSSMTLSGNSVSTYTIYNSTSFSFDIIANKWFKIDNSIIGLSPNTKYIFSYDIEFNNGSINTFIFRPEHYSGWTSITDEVLSNNSISKSFEYTSDNTISTSDFIEIYFYSNTSFSAILSNVKMYKKSEYDICIQQDENPNSNDPVDPNDPNNENQNDVPEDNSLSVDFSVIIPYLFCICSLIMLIIEINFIRNLFKSRR